MDSLINLPFEIQVSLVAGYLAYKVYVAGRGAIHKTEDVILQVVVLGLAGRLVAGALKAWATTAAGPRLQFPPEIDAVLLVLATLSASIALASYWRKHGNKQFSRAMNKLGIYNDDHEYTAWASLTNDKAKWTFIQVHLTDNRILESYFSSLPENPIGGDIVINDDGIVMYVTKIYGPDKAAEPAESYVIGTEGDMVATYVPRAKISQIEVGRIR